MKFEILDPRTDPEPAGWARFRAKARLHPVWGYELMRLEAWLARNPPVLVTATADGAIVAAMSVLVCRPRLSPRFAPLPGRPLLRPFWAEVYQPWLSGYPGVAFSPDVPAGDRRELLRRFERHLRFRLGPGLLGVLYRALGEEFAALAAGPGRLIKAVDTTAILENTFTTEEDWIASLDVNRRSSMRRHTRKLRDDPTLVVRGGPGRTDLDIVTITHLVNHHRTRFGKAKLDTRTPPAPAYFESFVRRPDVHTLTYHDDQGTLLGVNTMLDHPDSPALQHWAALTPEEGGRRQIYFDSYLRGVRYMTQRGAKELSAGRGMGELKLNLGFRPRQLHVAVVPRPVLGR
ncbi:GNAT family N-acetyltransferase [Amycolatopsis sp. H20-H5]|uniref:GNAT family N-acetyltransferase n=1 Tax=Amycolatopsis sp. H20-H5 TaxID=3046309 RepID=UPI002DB5B1A3|nr:GNAT family N-acetyltransferase [Amycolatopsis sp. H20-H5]MEC3977241.1 GNAT family N-acetyltransferase [Amycolatopsis sp. H20-H5]